MLPNTDTIEVIHEWIDSDHPRTGLHKDYQRVVFSKGALIVEYAKHMDYDAEGRIRWQPLTNDDALAAAQLLGGTLYRLMRDNQSIMPATKAKALTSPSFDAMAYNLSRAFEAINNAITSAARSHSNSVVCTISEGLFCHRGNKETNEKIYDKITSELSAAGYVVRETRDAYYSSTYTISW